MKIKKLLYIILTLMFFQGFSQQQNSEKRKQVKALKIAFITTELSLTPDEAIKFWPVFNVFDDKQIQIRSQKIKQYIDKTDDGELEKLSDKDAQTLLNQLENTEDDLYQNRKKFIANLRGIISPLKILKFKKAEDNFSKKLLQQYRDKKRD